MLPDQDAEIKSLWKANEHLADSLEKVEKSMFSDSERAALREKIEQDRRTRWIWSTARAWALWITAVVAGLTVGLDFLKAALTRLMS